MSHSAPNQLITHWKNARAVEPKDTPCYPCHAMVYTFETCNRDEVTGVAKCAANTSIEDVWQAFKELT